MRGSTVLIVDDTEGARIAISRLLRQAGYQTMCAANGREALDIMSSASPDLVLLDVVMPELGGLGLLEILRADSRWRDLPVVMFTGESDVPTVRRAKELGAGEYMIKATSSIAELLRVVARYTDLKMLELPSDSAGPVLSESGHGSNTLHTC
jgi:CheY-like chemotaxis protein